MTDETPMATRRTRLKRDVKDVDRAEIMARAECQYCADVIGPWEVDHVVPMSRGGTNDKDNLACACVSCNTQKSNHLLHEWKQWRQANGMFWPPIAQHSTDPRHYQDFCRSCRNETDWGDKDSGFGKGWTYAPYRLMFDGRGYRCYYQCGKLGHRPWTCFYAVGSYYYSDCECNYCVARRMEE